MIHGLEWTALPRATARNILAQLLGVEGKQRLLLKVSGRRTPLPFYKTWRLVWLTVDPPEGDDAPVLEDVLALWAEGETPILLDGSSAPVHEVNEKEGLQLEEPLIADYIRWFCLAVNANDTAFLLWEEQPKIVTPKDKKLLSLIRPLTAAGHTDEGWWKYEATVVYAATAFKATFAVQPDGEMTMLDDEPLAKHVPARLLPAAPTLGIGTRLQAYLATILGASPALAVAKIIGGSPRRKRTKVTRPTIVELVELLLESALRESSENRLLTYFNANLASYNYIQRFAALLESASPVVVVETNIAFVEETIAELVNDIRLPAPPLTVSSAMIETDGNGLEVVGHFSLPSSGPGIVLLPLQVYRRAIQVDRLAFDIAALDLAAIITCGHFEDLPESLRRLTDLVLHLPQLDADTFEILFDRVIGRPPPPKWRQGGIDWVKHILHTDFEHPRRMKLTPARAFAYVRAQVADRLRSVDPNAGQGLGLTDLHGLGEGREWAEDLIADIHAAIAGTLPWSQVDRGALLVGPPGTGKTTLAKAIAKSCGVKFIQGSATGWMAEGVSLGPHISAIRKTFTEARDYAPSILFIDEIDSLGSRAKFTNDNNSIYQTEVINAVLEQMQGLDPVAPVFVIGATNNEDGVDPALRRSGRLDRVIRIPRPNGEALSDIYTWYIGLLGPAVALDPSVDTRALGRLSVGLTGADVERIVRGAVRRARKAGHPLHQLDMIDEITNKPRGREPVYRLTPDDLERTATHEAGHALALFLSASNGSDIGFVTIIPRDNGTLGFVQPLPDERVHLTRQDYEQRLEGFVAGRAAEELRYGKEGITSGASNDLEGATALVTQMITQLGLPGSGKLLVSEALTAADTAHAESALKDAYQRVYKKLKSHRKQFDRLAAALADRQELTGDEARAILGP